MTLPITILMTTWAPDDSEGVLRSQAAEKAVASWQKNLKYEGELRLHVADDGSTLPGYGGSIDEAPAIWWPGPVSYTRQVGHGVGASFNAALRDCEGDLFLYLVDDWEAMVPFDLSPWADYLLHVENTGLVMFGPPYARTAGTVEMRSLSDHLWKGTQADPHNINFVLRMSSTASGVTYTQRPGLYHRRFFDRWGDMPEDGGAVWSEETLDTRWKEGAGDDIVLALQQPFHHIEGTEFGIIHPPYRGR